MTRLALLAHMRLDQIPSGFTTRSYFRNHDWTSNFRIRFGSNVKRRSCWETVGISDPPAQTRRTPHTAPGYGYPSVRIPMRTDGSHREAARSHLFRGSLHVCLHFCGQKTPPPSPRADTVCIAFPIFHKLAIYIIVLFTIK